MNPFTALPALYRQWLYFAYGFVALVFGAVSAYYYVTPDAALPEWLAGVGRVLAYLAIPFGALAGSNVTSKDGPPPAPHNDTLI